MKPLPAVTESQASATADAENTGLINKAIECDSQNTKICPPKAQRGMTKRIRGDN